MYQVTNYEIRKALVGLSIEKVLLELGDPVFNEVAGRLENDYKCFVPDCYEHPDYLNRVLKDIFGASHVDILKKIQKSLDEYSTDENIDNFLLKLIQ